jgi:hypothetical protein
MEESTYFGDFDTRDAGYDPGYNDPLPGYVTPPEMPDFAGGESQDHDFT